MSFESANCQTGSELLPITLINGQKVNGTNFALVIVATFLKLLRGPRMAKKKKLPIYKRGDMLANIVSLKKM